MSLALTGDTIAYLMGLGLNAEQMKGLVDRLQRDALAMAPPTSSSGINEERERLRNESTYAERKRAKDRERQRLLRVAAKQSRDVAVGSRDVADDPPATEGDSPATNSDTAEAPSRTRVVTLTSSLRSEGTQEANASFVDASNDATTPAEAKKPPTKPPKSQRGTRLPDDWEPSAEEFDLGKTAGLTDEEIHRAALEFRNYWCSRSRDATKLSWRLTWHNRVNELAERKQRNGARVAVGAAQPGGGRRGAASFADIYARRHGQASD